MRSRRCKQTETLRVASRRPLAALVLTTIAALLFCIPLGAATLDVTSRALVATPGTVVGESLGLDAAPSTPTTPITNLRADGNSARPGPQMVSRSSAAPISRGRAAKSGTTLYRAVGPDELADLQKLGRYRVPPGGTEGKYFFETPEQASNFARMMGDKPYTTASVRAPSAGLTKGDPINPVREGPGYFFRTPDVPSGPVTIFDRSVLP